MIQSNRHLELIIVSAILSVLMISISQYMVQKSTLKEYLQFKFLIFPNVTIYHKNPSRWVVDRVEDPDEDFKTESVASQRDVTGRSTTKVPEQAKEVKSEGKDAEKVKSKKREIFFIRTSTEPLEGFEICALYTAGNHNRGSSIIMYGFEKFQLPQFIRDLGNVRSEVLDFSSIFKETPLEKWYRSKIWNVTAQVRRVRYLCDAARHAYLYQYGGIYLDTDILVLRRIEQMENTIAWQHDNMLNGAFISSSRHHVFMRTALELEAKIFSPNLSEIEYGPKLLTKVYRLLNRTQPEALKDVSILPQSAIYPISYTKASVLHRKPKNNPAIIRALEKALTVHLWRNKMRSKHNDPKLIPRNGSILLEIAQNNCPSALPGWIASGENSQP